MSSRVVSRTASSVFSLGSSMYPSSTSCFIASALCTESMCAPSGMHAVRMGTVDVVPGRHGLDLGSRPSKIVTSGFPSMSSPTGRPKAASTVGVRSRTLAPLTVSPLRILRPLRDEDAVGAVLDRGSGRFDGDVLGPEVIRVESVIGNQDHGGVLAGEVQEGPEHHVVEAVPAFHDPLVDLEVLFLDEGLSRRVVLHETVTEVIDPVVVHRHEVPGLELHQAPSRHRGW